MDDDAPVLLGRLDVKLNSSLASLMHSQHDSSSSSSFSVGYQPPLAVFPQLLTLPQVQHHRSNQQQKQHQQQSTNPIFFGSKSSSSSPSSSSHTSFEGLLNRERSSWDVAALTSFREGDSSSAAASQQPCSSSSSNTNKPQQHQQHFRSARDALAALVAAGKLPGGSTHSTSTLLSATSCAAPAPAISSAKVVPSTMDIVKALDRFATCIGAGGGDQEVGAALRSQHFLHLLGYQRLEQLSGNVQALLRHGNENNSSNNSDKNINSVITNDATRLLTQPFKMFDFRTNVADDANDSSSNNQECWVTSRSKLYDALLNLAAAASSSPSSSLSPPAASYSLWAPPPTKKSFAAQTSSTIDLPQQHQGTVNWSHPSNDSSTVKSIIKADEPIECKLFSDAPASAAAATATSSNTTKWSVIVSVKQVEEKQIAGKARVDEESQVEIPLAADRVCFGRSLSSGTIRERQEMGDKKEGLVGGDDEADEEQEEGREQDGSRVAVVDPWHVDLSSVVRKLTNRVDHGLYISREHFVLLLRRGCLSNGADADVGSAMSLTMLPCSRNFCRVNGSVCYASPREGLKNGDVITIGSGRTSPAGVVVLVKIVCRDDGIK